MKVTRPYEHEELDVLRRCVKVEWHLLLQRLPLLPHQVRSQLLGEIKYIV